MRSSLIDVLSQDYCHGAGQGCCPRLIVVVHALKNAMIPFITMWPSKFATYRHQVTLEYIFAVRAWARRC